MASTLVEKILAAHAGRGDKDPLRPGETARVRVDAVLLRERDLFDALPSAREGVFDPERVLVVDDRFTPEPAAARRDGVRAAVKAFAREHRLRHLVGPGRGGALRVDAADRGFVTPGALVATPEPCAAAFGVLGCVALAPPPAGLGALLAAGALETSVPETLRLTFTGAPGRWVAGKDLGLLALARLGRARLNGRSVEAAGRALEDLDVHDRLAFAAMLAAAGAVAVFAPQDEKALAWVRARAGGEVEPVLADSGASVADASTLDVAGSEPMVALPHDPCNAVPLSDVAELKIERVVLGGATGGRIEDLRLAVRLLREFNVHDDVDLVVVPGSQRIFQHASEEGLLAALVRSGAVIAPPSSSLWDGPQLGIVGPRERCLVTTEGNERGRQGLDDAEIVLAGPAVAAATAVFGRVAHPDELLRRQREAV
jgi:3-isopropylmalate/(R)-2-methylmalate dehydratase large subunit